jgi:hypothetical protein
MHAGMPFMKSNGKCQIRKEGDEIMTRRIVSWVIVMMIVGSGAYGAVSDHVLEIIMSSTYNYDYPGVPLHYEFEVAIQVDATVVGGNMYAPDGTEYPMFYSSDGVESWLDVYFDGPDPSVWDGFGAGTYTFTFNYVSGSSDSTSVDYQLPNGDPIPYVTQQPQFVYPQHNAVDVPSQCTLQFDPANDPIHTIDIWIEPEDDTSGALEYDIMVLPHDTSSYGPVTLSPMTLYECGYTINHFFSFNNADGIPTEIDTDAGTQVNFTTAMGTPETMFLGLVLFIFDEVDSGNIAPELEGSLLAKIDAAISALDRGNPNDAKVAMNNLNALVNQVQAQTDKKITAEAAAGIIEKTNAVIAALSG